MTGYPGAKTASGVAKRIVSLMPRHDVYIEAFLGQSAVWQLKRPSPASIGVEIDGRLRRYWARRSTIDTESEIRWILANPLRAGQPGSHVVFGGALAVLTMLVTRAKPDWLVYLDPPYLRETRSAKRMFRHEFDTPEQHAQLLTLLKKLPCRVMISGYRSPLYAQMLEPAWRRVEFAASTRRGPRLECVWCNFPAGLPLHDVQFVGDGYRERERIKKKKQRWLRMLGAMPPAERQLIREAIEQIDNGEPGA
jgi:hypothetical protein